ncbi:MAG TPA: hypothetical protein VEK57_20335 [Thermoanaerobaculia bacterium]|nr:hypothetical protein [Thermoanaerobaculia bacterium]
MAPERTRAILKVLQRGREEKLAGSIMKIFGASSLEECSATYEMVGKAERASLDEAVERLAANAGAAFLLGVENEERR